MVALILMVAMNASTETSDPAAGVVAATVGPVELRRDAEMLRALPRSGLAEGDLLRTAEGRGRGLAARRSPPRPHRAVLRRPDR